VCVLQPCTSITLCMHVVVKNSSSDILHTFSLRDLILVDSFSKFVNIRTVYKSQGN
jgi:hypothetical protein